MLVQSRNGDVMVSGIDAGADVAVYSASGQLFGRVKADSDHATIATSLRKGDTVIVRIDGKAVKVIMQ